MISFDEAIDLMRSEVRPLGTETVAIIEAAGRVTASAIVAQIDAPRTDISAMDGYAVRNEDLAALPAALCISGESFAGGPSSGQLKPGTCVRIFTGAPVAQGTDRVVIQENVQSDGRIAVIDAHPGAADHIRRRGSDFRAGDKLLESGHLLDPRSLVAAAGADLENIEVFARPRITILGTGDELAKPGTARQRPNAIPESVSIGVAALAAQWGGLPRTPKLLSDDLEALVPAAGTAIDEADLVVVTGGASVGDRDFAKAMFEPHGLDLIFSKVAIKPGKPVWFGRAGDRLVIGLPGNPTSAMVTARLFLAPLLAALAGRNLDEALNWRKLPLAAASGKGDPRETFLRARLAQGAAVILSQQQSGAQKALVDADLLVRQPANSRAFDAGELVNVLDF